MRVSSSYRARAEDMGQISMIPDLDALIDELLKVTAGDADWDTPEITLLKQKLLIFSLAQLNDTRLSDQTREEVLLWMFEEMVEQGNAHPFSFQDCCLASELDPEEMRGKMDHQVRLLEAFLLNRNLESIQRRRPATVRKVLQWMQERTPDQYFSYERCCRAAKVNPELVLDQVLRQFN
jgi:hypothetical protein